tara:strand:+ start:528 stop:665 length:138 start_codon:yes stop_codon:yes gene_type:complete
MTKLKAKRAIFFKIITRFSQPEDVESKEEKELKGRIQRAINNNLK